MHLRRRVLDPWTLSSPRPSLRTRIRLRLSKRDGCGYGEFWQCHLIDTALPRNAYDFIFARWVFLFLPDPDGASEAARRRVETGRTLAIEDYSRWTLRMVPEPPEWENFLKADGAFFATQGGDVNIGGRLPQIYAKAGLDVIDITPTTKYGRPGSAEWEWLTTYFLGVMPQLRDIASVYAEAGDRTAPPLAAACAPENVCAYFAYRPRRGRRQTQENASVVSAFRRTAESGFNAGHSLSAEDEVDRAHQAEPRPEVIELDRLLHVEDARTARTRSA